MGAVFSFQIAIAKEVSGKGLEVRTWQGATRRSANLLEINTKPELTVLYVKESNISPGFWGLTKNRLSSLNKARIRWYAVFLARSSDEGYVLSSQEVKRRTQDGTFELSHDGDYKVNERTDFDSKHGFQGIKDFVARVL